VGATGAGLPKSAMAKNMSETPREKGVGAPAPTNAGLGQGTSAGSGNPDADAPRGFLYPPRPPLASHRDYDGSCGQGSFATPVPAFGFDTPSPDDRVMAARAKGTGGGAARLHAAAARLGDRRRHPAFVCGAAVEVHDVLVRAAPAVALSAAACSFGPRGSFRAAAAATAAGGLWAHRRPRRCWCGARLQGGDLGPPRRRVSPQLPHQVPHLGKQGRLGTTKISPFDLFIFPLQKAATQVNTGFGGLRPPGLRAIDLKTLNSTPPCLTLKGRLFYSTSSRCPRPSPAVLATKALCDTWPARLPPAEPPAKPAALPAELLPLLLPPLASIPVRSSSTAVSCSQVEKSCRACSRRDASRIEEGHM